MPAQILLPPGWAPPVGYANGVAVPAGRIVFIAGQVGWDEQQRFHSEELIPQFEQALKNVLAVLAEAEPHLPHDGLLHRQAGLYGRTQRARAHLAPADRQALPGDEHDLRRRPARSSGEDRARGDRRHTGRGLIVCVDARAPLLIDFGQARDAVLALTRSTRLRPPSEPIGRAPPCCRRPRQEGAPAGPASRPSWHDA
jgi:endoribonuclease L-PSP